MNVLLTSPVGKQALVNADNVRVYVPADSGRTVVHFVSGERMEVLESVFEIEAMLAPNYKLLLELLSVGASVHVDR